jgi:hypothetical protein
MRVGYRLGVTTLPLRSLYSSGLRLVVDAEAGIGVIMLRTEFFHEFDIVVVCRDGVVVCGNGGAETGLRGYRKADNRLANRTAGWQFSKKPIGINAALLGSLAV